MYQAIPSTDSSISSRASGWSAGTGTAGRGGGGGGAGGGGFAEQNGVAGG